MRIADGVEMLEIPANLMTGPGFVNPALIWDNEDVVLVDAGFPYQVLQFREAFVKAGVPFNRLSQIIITHSDTDHIGGLASLLLESPQHISVLAHENEKPYIQADLPPLRLNAMESQVKTLPEDRRKQMQDLVESLKANYTKLRANVDATIEDGEELPFCGGIIVIFTPGHTPGHVSLYHKQSKTLIAGDALNVENGMLVHAPGFSCLDAAQYNKSLQKFAAFDVRTVICYHGGLFKDNPNKRIAELIEAGITLS
jgi:glyoxylase-like metal-dependent hydrolase (beta-lactamase superfamily II)